ncbi:hypothetical protein X275_09900 [Marinitoga sp. 1197]|uniref:hypothetical protein n=1 Tax=Marinitoga sp. 1197 TaxID=1428449 RepID=UPI0006417061|nr:hypothetical protein [Marinitoga sp. 1197]KLO21290.1 hypothetical protein X275_09900 [Marinitoga sp. 1197]
MKKFRILIIVIMISITTIFSEDIGKFYIKTFDSDKMINYNKINIKIFGYLKKYLETGYSGYLKSANELRVTYNNELDIVEKKVFDTMSSINHQTTIEPIKRFEELKIRYPESLLIKSLLLEFEYSQWLITGDPKLAKIILNKIKDIENIMGEAPFTVYYKANFLYKSNIYGDKKEAYNIIKKGVLEFPDNKKIVETFLIISSQLKKEKEDKEIFEKIARIYLKEPENKENILLLIAKYFFEIGNKDFAKEILTERILSNSRNAGILFLTYELLGDYADTNIQKMNYYQKALKYKSESSRVMSKWALSMLKVDREKYKTLARIALNKAVTLDENISEEAKKALSDLRTEVKIEVFLNYVLPIILFIIISISILIYYEKRKERKEKDFLLKVSKEGEDNE